METRLSRAVVLVAYQLALLGGIVLFPVAVVANKVGVRLPVDRVLAWFHGGDEPPESR